MLDQINPQFIEQTMNQNVLTYYQYLCAFPFMEDFSAKSLVTSLVTLRQLGLKNDFCNCRNRPAGGSVRPLPGEMCAIIKYYPAF